LLVITSSVLAVLIFAGGAGTTALWATLEWNTTQAADAKSMTAADDLRASDVKAEEISGRRNHRHR
jgi:hypothetical protein